MTKRILRYIFVCLLAATMLSTVAFAMKDASEYIWRTTIGVATTGNGCLDFDCAIDATNIYSDVGIKWIEIYKKDGTFLEKHWYTDPGYEYLMGHNRGGYTATVHFQGEVGETYYATVCFYAGELGVAGDVHSMGSAIVTARK